FVFFRVFVDTRRHADVGRSGDVLHAHRLGSLKAPLDLLIGEILAETIVVGVKENAGIIELLADSFKVAEGGLESPLSEIRTFNAGGHHMSFKKFALPQSH